LLTLKSMQPSVAALPAPCGPKTTSVLSREPIFRSVPKSSHGAVWDWTLSKLQIIVCFWRDVADMSGPIWSIIEWIGREILWLSCTNRWSYVSTDFLLMSGPVHWWTDWSQVFRSYFTSELVHLKARWWFMSEKGWPADWNTYDFLDQSLFSINLSHNALIPSRESILHQLELLIG